MPRRRLDFPAAWRRSPAPCWRSCNRRTGLSASAMSTRMPTVSSRLAQEVRGIGGLRGRSRPEGGRRGTARRKAVLPREPDQLDDASARRRGIGRLAKRHGTLSIIDNSWATPLFQRPNTLGVDMVITRPPNTLAATATRWPGRWRAAQNSSVMCGARFVPISARRSPHPEAAPLPRGLRPCPSLFWRTGLGARIGAPSVGARLRDSGPSPGPGGLAAARAHRHDGTVLHRGG